MTTNVWLSPITNNQVRIALRIQVITTHFKFCDLSLATSQGLAIWQVIIYNLGLATSQTVKLNF